MEEWEDNNDEYGRILAGEREANDLADGCLVFGMLGLMMSGIGLVAIEMGRITGVGALHWFWATVGGSLQAMVLGQ